jgi:hypothetical protein
MKPWCNILNMNSSSHQWNGATLHPPGRRNLSVLSAGKIMAILLGWVTTVNSGCYIETVRSLNACLP